MEDNHDIHNLSAISDGERRVHRTRLVTVPGGRHYSNINIYYYPPPRSASLSEMQTSTRLDNIEPQQDKRTLSEQYHASCIGIFKKKKERGTNLVNLRDFSKDW